MSTPAISSPLTRDPVQVLLHDPTPRHRGLAHVALGRRALQRQDWSSAAVHLSEAIAQEASEAARQLSNELQRARESHRRRWFR